MTYYQAPLILRETTGNSSKITFGINNNCKLLSVTQVTFEPLANNGAICKAGFQDLQYQLPPEDLDICIYIPRTDSCW
jgi:hypothetical protein